MDLALEGLGVLVTGGAGGIGAATVRAFAADLTVEADADALVPRAVEALGRLDVCVANAGVFDSRPAPI
jgi:3-oxoacyl-[acyl-carrier protein] reductase